MEKAFTLAQVIRSRRIELGLTQEDLADRIGDGVRQADVSRLERGRVTLPRRERLERIAKALDLPVGELLARSGWAGADRSLGTKADVPEQSPARTPEPAPSITPPPLTLQTGPHLPTIRSQRLKIAIEQARALSAQAEEARQRAWESYERAMNGPTQKRKTPTQEAKLSEV